MSFHSEIFYVRRTLNRGSAIAEVCNTNLTENSQIVYIHAEKVTTKELKDDYYLECKKWEVTLVWSTPK